MEAIYRDASKESIRTKKLEVEHALWTHIEQEVKNTEIGQKAKLAFKHLVVSLGEEPWVGLWMLRGYGIAKIDSSQW